MHVVDDDKERKARHGVVGIENTEGRDTDFLKRLVLQGNKNPLK